MPMLLADESNALTHSQIFVSEQTLNLGLEAMYNSGSMRLELNVTSEFLAQSFPNFETVFGKR